MIRQLRHQMTFAALLRAVCLSALLVMVQAADLEHTHDPGLSSASDCEFCLQWSGSGDALVSEPLASIAPVQASLPSRDTPARANVTRTHTQARAPPVA